MNYNIFLDNLLESGKFHEALHQRVIKKSQLDIIYTDVINWERKDLLFIDQSLASIQKIDCFDFIEYTWIKIVEMLRKYGFSYEEIKLYKKEFTSYVPPEELINGIEQKMDDLAELSKEAAETVKPIIHKSSTLDLLRNKFT